MVVLRRMEACCTIDILCCDVTTIICSSRFFRKLGRPLHSQLFLFLLFLLGYLFELAPSLFLLHDHEVLKETVAEMLAHLFVLGHCELVVGRRVTISSEETVETGLKCETVHDVELAPHDDSRSLELALLQAELT